MAAKIINIVNGYSVRFDQRAKGEETPYWVGAILKDGTEVGTFNNSGRGGATFFHPHSLEVNLAKMATDEAARQGYEDNLFEAAGLIPEFAEMMGYKKGLKNSKPEEIFPLFIAEVIKSYKKGQ